MDTLYVNARNDRSFIALCKSFGASMLLLTEGRIEGINDGPLGPRIVLFNLNLTDDTMEQAQTVAQSAQQYRTQWQFNHLSKTATLQVGNKVKLVETLLALGVDKAAISKLQTVKASQLREFLDKTATEANEAEVSEIVVRLTEKNDRVEFTTKSSVLPTVTVELERSGGNTAMYLLTGSFAAIRKAVINDIETALKLPMYAGTTSMHGN